MLIVGAVLVIKNFRGGTDPLLVFMMVLPGIVLTMMTQVMWTRYRLEHGLAPPPPIPREAIDPEDEISSSEELTPEDGYTKRSRARRRLQRRRDRSHRPPAD